MTLPLLHPTLEVWPQSALIDEPLSIRLAGSAPGVPVTVTARMTDHAGELWASDATFLARDDGTVDLTTAAPVAGSYDGVEPMGLVWSMRRTGTDGWGPPFALNTLEPLTLTVTTSSEGTTVSATVERRLVATGVTHREVREGGLVGIFFRPPGAGPFPSVLCFGGSGGALFGGALQQAALLAARGYATLALAYFAMDGLPDTLANIPLEYFETALDWLAAQPAVRDDTVAALGASRGGELALLLGATFPRVRAVVAYVPSHVSWGGFGPGIAPGTVPAWTYRGEPVSFPRRRSGTAPPSPPAPDPDTPVVGTPSFLTVLAIPGVEAEAAIVVERINGPVLLLSGQDDQMWPSALMAARASDRLTAHQHPFPVEHHAYDGAGHLFRLPFLPETVTAARHRVSGVLSAFGGTPRGNARAADDAWSRTRAFLDQHLT